MKYVPLEIFVVLDPTSMEQPSLDWGERMALDLMEQRSRNVQLHVYCCVNETSVVVPAKNDAEVGEKEAVARIDSWIQRLTLHTRNLGITVDTEVEWKPDWRAAIVAAARRRGSELVIKNLTQHSRLVRWVRDTSDWRLVRDCECPVLLVKTGRSFGINRILIAVKHTDEEDYREANLSILSSARSLAEDFGATLHAVTCYEPDNHPDRQRFADGIGLARSQVSAVMGTPAREIAAVANRVEADLLVVARVARPGSSGVLGDTACRVIDEVDTGVLVLPMRKEDLLSTPARRGIPA